MSKFELYQHKYVNFDAYVFQIVVPNDVSIFGSARQDLFLNKCTWGGRQSLYIKRVHVKALDQPIYHCDNEGNSINTSACIANFIEKKIGCNPHIQGSQYSLGLPCTTKDQLLKLKYYLDMFPGFDDKDVYNLTGCKSSCEKDVFSFVTEPILCHDQNFGQELILDVMITDRWYEEKEQYIIYDTDSFIADVGGYMGLILGFSILSIYHEIEALLKRFIPLTLCLAKRNIGVEKSSEVV